MALDLQVENLWIESDSIDIVDCIQGRSKTPWKIKRTCSSIKSKLQGFMKWEISHTWREANRVADHLAKVGLTRSSVVLWPNSLFEPLGVLVNDDVAGTMYPRL